MCAAEPHILRTLFVEDSLEKTPCFSIVVARGAAGDEGIDFVFERGREEGFAGVLESGLIPAREVVA